MRYGELQFDDNESDTSLYAQDNSAQAEELDQCRARVVELEQQVDQIKKDAEKKEEEIAEKDKRLADHEATVARQAYGLSCMRLLLPEHSIEGRSVDSERFQKLSALVEKLSIAPWYKHTNQSIRYGKHAQEQAHKIIGALQQAFADLGIEAKLGSVDAILRLKKEVQALRLQVSRATGPDELTTLLRNIVHVDYTSAVAADTSLQSITTILGELRHGVVNLGTLPGHLNACAQIIDRLATTMSASGSVEDVVPTFCEKTNTGKFHSWKAVLMAAEHRVATQNDARSLEYWFTSQVQELERRISRQLGMMSPERSESEDMEKLLAYGILHADKRTAGAFDSSREVISDQDLLPIPRGRDRTMALDCPKWISSKSCLTKK